MNKILSLSLVISFLFSCKKEATPTTVYNTNINVNCSKTISYKNEISPMLNMYCIGCHSSNQSSGGINLSGFSNASNLATRSLNSIKNGSMPPMGSIPDSLVQKLSCWISQGKANN
jgi:hypothetical protein